MLNKISKLLIIALFVFPSSAFSAGLVHPLDFSGSEKEKQQVIEYIKANVKKTYTDIGMGDPATLRMMENKELESFKQLTKVTNRKMLDSVIKTYCEIGMCNYSTLSMMYNKQLEASQKKLEW